ncbi:RagB/SusD family nutrient uptake outer membrane protein [Arenibacter sp. BSSL-BM3]|uniref:RagB/SusD family nutrient uptake outer membrane protein n=1 Tax=Arenibacter arenosicollis TaxID=2762274 RepID=A0ABR7QP17_9FLAO|nr:RagB/SusD family nutrient uptake outer membrane protein [Arenibacter arenosicollis]MBC8768950.1 RagB/SusD family nutrient uptake outer membrane protein [Arenibacter arenosicollis]
MKKYINFKTKAITLLMTVVAISSCETDFDNPNAATDDQVFSSREGILAATIGMQQLYSTTGLRWIVETPAVTTREAGITTTFQNMIDLEDGGDIPNSTSNIVGLWSTMLRVMSISEDIAKNAPDLNINEGTKSGLVAYANLFKAMAIGSMAQNYEQAIVNISQDGDATFVSRTEAFNTAVALINEAQNLISSNPISDEFSSEILRGNIDLENTLQAMSARYNLFAGNYDAAITAATSVDLTATSVFTYDSQNLNPVWSRVFQNGVPNFKPRDNFGLPNSFTIDPADGRVDFYLVPLDELNINQLPIEDLAGFFDEESGTESIPVYLTDEMNLIIAEANLRKNSADISAAVTAINNVRTDNDDVFGVNANISAYSGDLSVDALLDEVYLNRRLELFLTGTSLEDSRRFGRPEPSTSAKVFTDERNRNFYPYPNTERDNNSNTPADPSI